MKGSGLVFDYLHLLYCNCHKVNPNHGMSYTDWMENQKATINQ